MRRKNFKRGKRPTLLPKIEVDVATWLANNPDHLINCPNQPGHLKLSREACAKRHIAANQPRWANVGAEPFPLFVIKMNLIPCRNCKVGSKMAKKYKEKAA